MEAERTLGRPYDSIEFMIALLPDLSHDVVRLAIGGWPGDPIGDPNTWLYDDHGMVNWDLVKAQNAVGWARIVVRAAQGQSKQNAAGKNVAAHPAVRSAA